MTKVDERLKALAVGIAEARQRGQDASPLIAQHRAISEGRRQRREEQRPATEPPRPILRFISSVGEFRQIGPQWEHLLLRSHTVSPFMTHDWLVPWLETFGSEHTPHIAVVQSGERLLAAAPLMLGIERDGWYLGRVARFVGTGRGLRGNYFCFPVRTDAPPEAVRMLKDYLSGLSANGYVVHLEHLSPFRDGQQTVEILCGAARRSFALETELPCIHGALPDSFEEFIESVPVASRRAHLRRREAPLQQACGRVTFETCRRAEDLEEYLADMARFSVLRRQLQGQHSTWEDPRNMSCRHPACEAFLRRDMLRLDRVLCEGRPVAVLAGVVYRDTYFCYNTGFEPAYSQYEPGHALLARRIEACIAEGLARFNFLVGEADYKRQYFRESSPELTFTCMPSAGRARLLYGLRRLASAVRSTR